MEWKLGELYLDRDREKCILLKLRINGLGTENQRFPPDEPRSLLKGPLLIRVLRKLEQEEPITLREYLEFALDHP